MKRAAAFGILLVSIQLAHGQDQEQKLINRLLKPNTELRNDAQDKKFLADGASVNKKATVGAFYWQQKSNTKQFSATRQFSTPDFNSHPFYAGSNRSKFETGTARGAQRSAWIASAQSTKPFHDRDKVASSRDFSGKRPFLDKGKSAKSFERKNEPMTIEQVRELLNKNK